MEEKFSRKKTTRTGKKRENTVLKMIKRKLPQRRKRRNGRSAAEKLDTGRHMPSVLLRLRRSVSVTQRQN